MVYLAIPFLKAIHDHVVLFDGAMGTQIQSSNLGPQDFPNMMEGFNDGLVLTNPELIKRIHRNYLAAGADCIETNTFGGNKIKLSEYGCKDEPSRLIRNQQSLLGKCVTNSHTQTST